jgi:hypothetical protein
VIHFYDAATPQNVPSGVYAAVYINGYAWPESQIDRMSRVIRVSVHPEAFWAKYARVIDVENGAASPDNVVPFIRERIAHGHHDATAYVNRSNWDAVKQLVAAAKLEAWVRYWVATLDGTQDVPGAWAVQYATINNAYDLSVLHGVNDFSNP